MIRFAKIEDLKFILEIVNDAILNTTAIYDYDQRTLKEQMVWFDEKNMQGFPVIVATDENENVIGFGTYGTFRSKIGFKFTVEHSLYIKNGFSGKGIGKAILAELIFLAKAQNIHVMVGCIDAENTGSIVFHEKLGFVRSGKLLQAGYKFNRWLDLQFVQLILE